MIYKWNKTPRAYPQWKKLPLARGQKCLCARNYVSHVHAYNMLPSDRYVDESMLPCVSHVKVYIYRYIDMRKHLCPPVIFILSIVFYMDGYLHCLLYGHIPIPTCVSHMDKSMPTCVSHMEPCILHCDSHMLPCVRHMEKSMPTCVSHMDPCILHCLLYGQIPMPTWVRHEKSSMPTCVSHMELLYIIPCLLYDTYAHLCWTCREIYAHLW